MKRQIFGVLVLSLLLVDTSWGFDGNRRGFVLGGGLGITHASLGSFTERGSPSSAGVRRDPETNVGVGGQLLIGYGWNDRNMIVYEGTTSVYNNSRDRTVVRLYSGVSWYHYFSSPGQSVFTVAGTGIYAINRSTNFVGTFRGLIIGGGYEFARHWQAGAYFSSSIHDLDELHVNILVSAVAF